MPLFGHHHKHEPGGASAAPDGFTGQIPAGFTGLPEFGGAEGWEPVPGQPFDGHLETAVHEISRAMYGAARTSSAVMQTGIRVGGTTFPDAFQASAGGRTVIVANAWTSIEAEVPNSTRHVWGAAA